MFHTKRLAARSLLLGLLSGLLALRPESGLAQTRLVGAGHNKGVAVALYAYSGTTLASVIADLQGMGVSWIRMDFPWSDMNSSPGVYNTAAWDNAVRAAGNAGIQVLGTIDYTPDWARPPGSNKFYPPSNPSDYANFAAFLAARYGPMGVHTWELWNEENGSTYFQPAPDPVVYSAMLQAAYPAIHQADTSALVMIGGMATFSDDGINYNARTFLSALYAHGAGTSFDAVAMHPYVYPTMPASTPDNNWGQMSASNPSLRSVMTANGDGAKQVWLTEMGFPTLPNNPPFSEQEQADYLTQAYQLQAGYAWAGPLFWYTYSDPANGDPGNAEDWFGLVRGDGSFKPAHDAYRNLPD